MLKNPRFSYLELKAWQQAPTPSFLPRALTSDELLVLAWASAWVIDQLRLNPDLRRESVRRHAMRQTPGRLQQPTHGPVAGQLRLAIG
jgi:hypothetical protein